jgi:hypothetical protein
MSELTDGQVIGFILLAWLCGSIVIGSAIGALWDRIRIRW